MGVVLAGVQQQRNGKKGGPPLPANFFRGKIVVIGADRHELQDIHPTSTDNSMPGPEIQANAIDTVLDGSRFLRPGLD